MTIYNEREGEFIPWNPAERINDVLYPPNIEWLLTTEQLAELGLIVPAEAEPVPAGKRIVSTSVERVAGVVRFVHVLEDEPVEPVVRPVLTNRQFWKALALTGAYDTVTALVATMPLADRIEALQATEYHFDHWLITESAPVLGLTEKEFIDLWYWASTL